MYKVFLHIVFFFCLLQGNAQTNLIYNGDFELYDTCPYTTSSVTNYQIERCLGWKAPTYATSDYFNTCAGMASGIAPPYTAFGYQLPFSGNAYCGIYNQYYIQSSVPYMGFWFEYLQGNLIESLKQGYEYEFSCMVVMPEGEYGFWKFGCIFSNDEISRTDPKPFTGIVPQIMNQPFNYLMDSVNWTEIRGKFVAQGGEKFITIGFFSDTMNLDTLRNGNIIIDPTNFGSYYFVDACNLRETGNIFYYPNIFSPNGDGVNDFWIPFVFVEGQSIMIYNRWGNLVYEVDQVHNQWGGKDRIGNDCVEGVYYYVVKGQNKNFISKGFIQLVR